MRGLFSCDKPHCQLLLRPRSLPIFRFKVVTRWPDSAVAWGTSFLPPKTSAPKRK